MLARISRCFKGGEQARAGAVSPLFTVISAVLAVLRGVTSPARRPLVTSSPTGIACGGTCTATFSAAPVTLTAAPDGTHTFSGWSGACTGTGSCVLPLDTATSAVTAKPTMSPYR